MRLAMPITLNAVRRDRPFVVIELNDAPDRRLRLRRGPSAAARCAAEDQAPSIVKFEVLRAQSWITSFVAETPRR
jgi:hypothetical protein